MVSSITRTLHHWLKENRLTVAVAQRMGISESTLSSELRNSNHQAKLGADQLVPLFHAIRDLGYGAELDGIVARFVKELEGEESQPASVEQFSALLFEMMDGIGVLSKSANRIDAIKTERELMRLKTKIRTEIIPAVFKLEDIVDTRLEQVRSKVSEPAAGLEAFATEPNAVHTGA